MGTESAVVPGFKVLVQVSSSKFWVSGSGSMKSGTGSGSDFQARVSGFWFLLSGPISWFQGTGSWVRVSGLKCWRQVSDFPDLVSDSWF